MIVIKNKYTVRCDNCHAEVEQMSGSEYSYFGDPETAVEYAEGLGVIPMNGGHICNDCFIDDFIDEDRKGAFKQVEADERYFISSGCLPPYADDSKKRSIMVGILISYNKERFKGYYDFIQQKWFLTLWNDESVKSIYAISSSMGVSFDRVERTYLNVKKKGYFSNEDLRYLTALGYPAVRELSNITNQTYDEVIKMVTDKKITFPRFREMFLRSTKPDGIFGQVLNKRNESRMIFDFLDHTYFLNPVDEVNSWFKLETDEIKSITIGQLTAKLDG